MANPCATPEKTWKWYDALFLIKMSSARRRDSSGKVWSTSADEAIGSSCLFLFICYRAHLRRRGIGELDAVCLIIGWNEMGGGTHL